MHGLVMDDKAAQYRSVVNCNVNVRNEDTFLHRFVYVCNYVQTGIINKYEYYTTTYVRTHVLCHLKFLTRLSCFLGSQLSIAHIFKVKLL